MFYIYKYNSQVLFSSSEMQRSQLPGRSQGRAAASSWGQQVFSQPGTVCLDCEWVKVAAPGLGALHKQHASGVLSKLHLPSLPVLGCQSAVTRPHISSVCTSPGCQQSSWWDSAPSCQSSLFLFSAREIFWLRETKKPGRYRLSQAFLPFMDIRS